VRSPEGFPAARDSSRPLRGPGRSFGTVRAAPSGLSVCLGRGTKVRIRPQIRKDYPLSLSISLSGGEETNQDFPSNGERTGKSPA